MRKPLLAFTIIVIIVLAQLIATVPVRKSLRAQLNPNYVRAMAAYKRLEPKLSREELRAITTIGILNGVQQTEKQMEQQLTAAVKDFVTHADITAKESVIPKIEAIEKQLQRDQRALEILTSAMDLATKTKNLHDFREEMQHTLQEVRRQTLEDIVSEDERKAAVGENNSDINAALEDNEQNVITAKVANLRENILKQVYGMKSMVEKKIQTTLDYLIDEADEEDIIAKASHKIVRKRNADKEEPAEIRMINSILNENDFRNNLIETDVATRKAEPEVLDKLELYDKPEGVDKLELDDFELDSKEIVAKENNSSLSSNNNKGKESKAKSSKSNSEHKNTTSTSSATKTKTPTTKTPKNAKQLVGKPAKQEVEIFTPELLPQTDDDDENAAGAPADADAGSDADDDAPAGGGGGGGLVGIIGSLSGGEGGSDVGALIGSLTGVISTLFGPNGLDIESLISTGTSLIAGLLSGNKNFGTVLGQYVGTAFEGLSGGGGAINNGQFIGNFLGTVVASLSADPEDDDAPGKPLLFVQNVLSSFVEAKNRKASEEVSEERKDNNKNGGGMAAAGSDSGAFIKHIASHLVGSVVSFILNASLGASGGASHASSSSIFAHSSGGAKPAPAKG